MKPGDKVAYSVQFLKSIGESHGELARARGEITEIKEFGGLKLAAIKWAAGDFPANVNVNNLAIVGPNRRFCNVD